MGDAARKVIHEALALTPSEREEVLEALLHSLQAPEGILSEGDPGFTEELERRAAEVERGDADLVPWEDVRARLRNPS